jgi:hypothetical protein
MFHLPLSLPSPVVCTLSTGEVDSLCLKNGLAFHELLSAFSLCQLKTQFRSISGHYGLNELRVRFVRASELQPRDVAKAEPLFHAAVRLRDDGDDDWYRRYRALLKESLCCVEESMAECPAVLMLAVSTSDADPLACFEQLEQHYMPVAFTKGHFDPTAIARIYLLVNDVAQKSEDKSGNHGDLFRQMKQRFRTANCYLLNMNSLKEDNLNLAAPDVWNDSIMTTFFPEQIPQVSPAAAARGCCLSADDMLAIRDLVHQVSWYTVVFDIFFCCRP